LVKKQITASGNQTSIERQKGEIGLLKARGLPDRREEKAKKDDAVGEKKPLAGYIGTKRTLFPLGGEVGKWWGAKGFLHRSPLIPLIQISLK